MKIRPIGIVREIVESAGSSISYFYDDLVFGDNNLFIFQFDDSSDNRLFLYFNKDCDEKIAANLGQRLMDSALVNDFSVTKKGKYRIGQIKGEENLKIIFEK